jgi:hypothetical protein
MPLLLSPSYCPLQQHALYARSSHSPPSCSTTHSVPPPPSAFLRYHALCARPAPPLLPSTLLRYHALASMPAKAGSGFASSEFMSAKCVCLSPLFSRFVFASWVWSPSCPHRRCTQARSGANSCVFVRTVGKKTLEGLALARSACGLVCCVRGE